MPYTVNGGTRATYTAGPGGPPPRRVDVGSATETDTALGAAARRAVVLGIAQEFESGYQLTGQKIRTLGQATETDTGLGFLTGPPLVQPVAWWGSDTASSSASFPTPRYVHPHPSATYLAGLDATAKLVQQWYWDVCDHYTFDLLPAVAYTAPETEAALNTSHPGIALITQGMTEASAANPSVIDLTREDRLYYMATPLNNPRDTYGGLNGVCLPGSAYGAVATELPCGCTTWGNYSTTPLGSLIGGMPPTPGTNDTLFIDFARGNMAHEMAHAFGYDASMPVVGDGDTLPTNFLPHRYDGLNPYILMARFAAGGLTNLGSTALDATEKARIKASPFITLHASRP